MVSSSRQLSAQLSDSHRGCYLVTAIFFVLFLAVVPISQVLAWGYVGHRVVCEMAFDILDSDMQSAANKLVRSFAKPNGRRFKDFRESCAFADTARHNARDGLKRWQRYTDFDRWHYMNVPRTTARLTRKTKLKKSASNSMHNVFQAGAGKTRGILDVEKICQSDCVIHAIAFHSRILGDPELSRAKRAEALIFLSHWIADIHQPLHVGFADDRGGSKIRLVLEDGVGKNLHSAWDAGLIKRSRGKRKLRQYIHDLSQIEQANKVEWAREFNPLQWAAESYNIATSVDAKYCQWKVNPEHDSVKKTNAKSCQPISTPISINEQYVSRITPLLEKRLQQAAVRLATHLAKLLD